ncbi:hypothetical protein CK203_055338 [Vitis vinifera]|uniref:Uncharacterized protein n=1 Tax=Vitis vinifera TaxID=29760 RepID=A0A438GSU7_VITVI|nr:hypothetical protein CK203_055338 [Vitis vinifera]
MCGGDDHLAWKCLISSEACRGLRTAGGLSLGPIRTLFLHMGASVGLQSQSFHYCKSIGMFDLGLASWIRVRGRLIRMLDQSDKTDMDLQMVTVDQFAAAMASIQEAKTNLGQRMDGQQTQQVPV